MPVSGTKYVEHLVVDTSAFINNVALQNFGEKVLTIPEVIAEVRNKRQYRHLFSLTQDVELKDVFSESIIFVTEFAKKTGDYAALSATDIKLIALTYQLEIENVGRDHLRTEPVISNYDVNVKTKTAPVQGEIANGLCLPVKIDKYNEHRERHYNANFKDCETNESDEDEYDTANENLSENENCTSGEETGNEDDIENEEESEEESQSNEDEYEVDDDGWITPDNINELRRASNKNYIEEKSVVVGCLSTDFAIQNVLMQIGLNVVTVDGKIIRELRSYILRCYACFKTTANMKRVFCPNCGNKTLKRVSVYFDKEGNKRMFINFKKPISTRGKRFSLPMPQGGKHAVNPKLVADARRPHQKPTRLAKMKTNAMHDDYIAGSSPFVMRDIHSRSAQHGFNKGKYVFKSWMRRNPNVSRRNPKK